MRIAYESAATAGFADYLIASRDNPVIFTRKGRPIAVLVPVKNEDEAERLVIGYSPKVQAMLNGAEKRFRQGKGIPEKEFWRQVEAENKRKAAKRTGSRKNGRKSSAAQKRS